MNRTITKHPPRTYPYTLPVGVHARRDAACPGCGAPELPAPRTTADRSSASGHTPVYVRVGWGMDELLGIGRQVGLCSSCASELDRRRPQEQPLTDRERRAYRLRLFRDGWDPAAGPVTADELRGIVTDLRLALRDESEAPRRRLSQHTHSALDSYWLRAWRNGWDPTDAVYPDQALRNLAEIRRDLEGEIAQLAAGGVGEHRLELEELKRLAEHSRRIAHPWQHTVNRSTAPSFAATLGPTGPRPRSRQRGAVTSLEGRRGARRAPGRRTRKVAA